LVLSFTWYCVKYLTHERNTPDVSLAETVCGSPFPEYVAIAEARLNGVQRGLGLDVGAPVRKRTTKFDPDATANRHKSGFKPSTGWFGLDGGDKPGTPEEAA
jgi:hypothetical protein